MSNLVSQLQEQLGKEIYARQMEREGYQQAAGCATQQVQHFIEHQRLAERRIEELEDLMKQMAVQASSSYEQVCNYANGVASDREGLRAAAIERENICINLQNRIEAMTSQRESQSATVTATVTALRNENSALNSANVQHEGVISGLRKALDEERSKTRFKSDCPNCPILLQNIANLKDAVES